MQNRKHERPHVLADKKGLKPEYQRYCDVFRIFLNSVKDDPDKFTNILIHKYISEEKDYHLRQQQ